jgi:hypothetical protein
MERSLNLSDEDLQSFEIAMDQDLLSPHQSSEVPLLRQNDPDVDQLGIPYGED